MASPAHTPRELSTYIQALKKKLGIDYDSHASYRFVEAWSNGGEAIKRQRVHSLIS
jgi:hypothetical protein